jgi:hypothetical protein
MKLCILMGEVMNLYVTQTGQLRFADGNAYMELLGWCVRAGYKLESATALYGASSHLTRSDAIAYAKKAMAKIGYKSLNA